MTKRWPERSLGEICTFNYGKALPAAKRTGEGKPVYGSNGEVGRHAAALTDGPTIVIGRKGSFGEVHFSTQPCWPIDTTYYIDADSTDADLRWLAYRLRALGLTSLNRAAAIPGLNREDAYRQRLLVPPIEEQRRIAAVLDHAHELRMKRQAALVLLDSLNESIYLEMFGDPVANPFGWPRAAIGDICHVKGGKRLPKGTPYSLEPTPWRYIRVSDFTNGRIEAASLPYVPAQAMQKIRRYDVKLGDLVLSIAGTIGRVAVVGGDASGAYLSENAAKLRPRTTSSYVPEFLAQTIQHWSMQAAMVSRTGQVTIGKLALFRIAELEVPLPPLELQARFVDRAESVALSRLPMITSLRRIQQVGASLQQRAFAGQL